MRREILAACMLLWTAQGAGWAAALTAYHSVVSYSSQNAADVKAQFFVQGGVPAQGIKLILYSGQTISGWRQDGTEAASPLQGSGGASIRLMPGQAGEYTVSYHVSSRGMLAHVPLPVPDAPPATSARLVQLEVVLPDGWAVYDDAFPQQNWVDATHGKTSLPAVPSAISVRFAPASAVNWRTRWMSMSRLSTLFMVLILIGGIAFLYRGRRRARVVRRAA